MKLLIFKLSIFCFAFLEVSAAQNKSVFIKKYLDKFSKSNYSPLVLPPSCRGDGKPVDVICYIGLEVLNVDDANMDFTVIMDFSLFWNDSRLAFPDDDIEYITFKDEKPFWTPTLHFQEAKEVSIYHLDTPNVSFGIQKDGSITFCVQMKVVLSCQLKFENYPLDIQTCHFYFQSYEYELDKLEFVWDGRFKTNGSTNYYQYLRQYHFTNLNGSVMNIIGFSLNNDTERPQWSSLKFHLTFQRKVGFFVRILYVPLLFLTALSWLPFWIPAKLFAQRLSLLVAVMILVLMVHIGYEVNASPPMTSYSKASDVWIAVCESLVFAAFIEFIFVHVVIKLQEGLYSSNSEEKTPDSKLCPESTEQFNKAVDTIFRRLKRDFQLSGRIDQVCRVLFPALFIFFNCIYWVVYTARGNTQPPTI